MFAIIVFYCALSGLYGVMVTDVIQVAIGGFGVVLGTVLAVNKIGGLSRLAALPAQELSLFPADMSTLVWLVVPTTLLGLVSQPSYQRVNACQNEKTAFRAPLLAACVVMVLAFFPVLAGMCASILWPDLDSSKAVPQLLKEVFPPVVAAIFIAAILAAIMSTADSVLLAGVANVVRDIYQQILRPDATDKELLRTSTLATVSSGSAPSGSRTSSPGLSICSFFPTRSRFVAGSFPWLARWCGKKEPNRAPGPRWSAAWVSCC